MAKDNLLDNANAFWNRLNREQKIAIAGAYFSGDLGNAEPIEKGYFKTDHSMKRIIDLFIEQKKEVRIATKHPCLSATEPMMWGKIIEMGDDYIAFEGDKHYPKLAIIPIENILMIIPSEKPKGSGSE